MINNLLSYKTLVFDCDGVILNSNKIKTKAFYEVARKYGEEPARKLVEYHISNGGISRFAKFDYFFRCILGRENFSDELSLSLDAYASLVKHKLLDCEQAEGIAELRNLTPDSRWMVVSGGMQDELRDVFNRRGLYEYFDYGIYGSPDTKSDILVRELSKHNIITPVILLGDSRYDYEVSRHFGIDFLFVTEWTELIDWEGWVYENTIPTVRSISQLCLLHNMGNS